MHFEQRGCMCNVIIDSNYSSVQLIILLCRDSISNKEQFGSPLEVEHLRQIYSGVIIRTAPIYNSWHWRQNSSQQTLVLSQNLDCDESIESFCHTLLKLLVRVTTKLSGKQGNGVYLLCSYSSFPGYTSKNSHSLCIVALPPWATDQWWVERLGSIVMTSQWLIILSPGSVQLISSFSACAAEMMSWCESYKLAPLSARRLEFLNSSTHVTQDQVWRHQRNSWVFS